MIEKQKKQILKLFRLKLNYEIIFVEIIYLCIRFLHIQNVELELKIKRYVTFFLLENDYSFINIGIKYRAFFQNSSVYVMIPLMMDI